MKKFVDTRQARKKVTEDVQLLENRIKLLKLEEKKVILLINNGFQAWKKIEDTKKKAREIAQNKQR